jgi:HlyD family secretion protein
MWHRTRRIRWPALVVAGVVVAGSGAAYAVSSDGSAGSYRTIAARKGDVEQVLSTVGTVDAAHRADLEFGTSGTVASVRVAPGDRVRAGQVIATLDTGTLDAAVTRARAGVARAVAQLATDESAQAAAVSAAASQTSRPKSNTPSASPTHGTATSATLEQLKAQQDAVTAAQAVATGAIAAAKDALAAQTLACADAYQDQPAPTASPGSGDQAGGVGQGTASTAQDASTACSDALALVEHRQDDVSAAQDALAKALATLAETLGKALAAVAPSNSAGAGSATRTTAPSSGSTTPATTGSGATSGAVSAARLAADQATIEQARADLVDARQQRRQAVLRSTRAGRVVALDLAKGDDVTAGSTVATVVGGTAVTVEASVGESKIDQVKVGERVRVTTPGGSDETEGTVTAIGLVADSSSGTASYPVTVTVEDPTIALPAGSQAMLAIVVATAKDVVTVPTSAVTRRGDNAYVQTWDGKNVTRQVVELGTLGARDVEITDGLAAGDEVVLADLDRAITGASDTINDRGGFNGPPVMRFDRGSGAGGGPVTFRSRG